jgi:hypothetical protein
LLSPAIFKDSYVILHSPEPIINNNPMILLSRLSNDLTHAGLVPKSSQAVFFAWRRNF